MTRIIGIDYGAKRIGIAVSSDDGGFALPHSVIQNIGDESALVRAVTDLAQEKGATTLVLGESRDYAGAANPIMAQSLAFKAALESTGLRVVLEPEFMTSHQAERLRFELKGNADMRDASAAAVILQSFLDKQPR